MLYAHTSCLAGVMLPVQDRLSALDRLGLKVDAQRRKVDRQLSRGARNKEAFADEGQETAATAGTGSAADRVSRPSWLATGTHYEAPAKALLHEVYATSNAN